MAKDGPGGEKTEKPTPQRLKKARKEGQIPRTQELGTWAGAAVASVLLPMLVENAYDETRTLFLQINDVAAEPVASKVFALLGQALAAFLSTLLPMALGLMVVGVAASAAQGGVSIATKGMKPTLKKLNPFPGMKRMFGTHGLWEAVKALIKTVALAAVVIVTSDRAQELVSASGLTIALPDYVVVRTKTMRQLRMSKYEIQQEHKRSEGDPHMKAHRRS